LDSNVTDARDLQFKEQEMHTTSTDAGLSMVFTSLPRNLDSSIRYDFEFDSNVTVVSDVHL
jgi:hypothetical protein